MNILEYLAQDKPLGCASRVKYKNREIYILAQVKKFQMSLIGLGSGNRWQDPVKVKDNSKITKKEAEKIFGIGKYDSARWEDFEVVP